VSAPVDEFAVTVEDVERTSRDTTVAQWGVATVVMAGSAVAGGLAFHYLGQYAVLGVITALAVDLALAQWLRIDRRLRATGVRCRLGTALEVVTAVMTVYLAVGSAVFRGIDPDSVEARVLLAVAHSFLPVVLVLVTLAGSQAHLKLLELRRRTAATEQVRRDTEIAGARGGINRPTVAPSPAPIPVVTVAPPRPTAVSQPVRPARTTPPVPSKPPSRPTPVPVTDELLSRARVVRDEQVSQGKTAGHVVLRRKLGVPERVAKELVKRLDEPPLRIVGGKP
jgi:hypothetical protein